MRQRAQGLRGGFAVCRSLPTRSLSSPPCLPGAQSLPGHIGTHDVADCLAGLQAAVDAGPRLKRAGAGRVRLAAAVQAPPPLACAV